MLPAPFRGCGEGLCPTFTHFTPLTHIYCSKSSPRLQGFLSLFLRQNFTKKVPAGRHFCLQGRIIFQDVEFVWKSAVFLGVLAQVGAHGLYLCGILHHRLFRGLEHVVAVVGHSLTQRARLALGSGGDLGGALLGGFHDLGIAHQDAGALFG